jgi:hypothetical protein
MFKMGEGVFRFFFLLECGSTESTITKATTGLLHQSQMMMDDDECEAISGMIGRGNQRTWKKPAPVPLRPPQIPHDLTWPRTRAAAMVIQHSHWRCTGCLG